MAEDKERDSTDESRSSADPRRPEYDQAAELGSEADAVEEFEPEDGPERADLASDDPDAGDVPEAESPYEDGVDEGPAYEDRADEDRADEDGTATGRSDDDLVGVGASRRRTRSDVEARAGSTAARPKKAKPTPRQHAAADRPRRTGPVRFVKESVGELQKVVYPTGQQLVQYFVVVLIFVLFIIAIVSLLDLGFGWAIFQIFS